MCPTTYGYLLPRVLFVMCLVGLWVVYIIYYLVFNVLRPRVVCSDERRLRALRQHCPCLFERYWPTVWALHGHVQSTFRVLIQRAPSLASFNPRREKVYMKDGGYVCLDWFNERGNSAGGSGSDPIILLLPGVTGSSDDQYVRHWIDDCYRLGYRCVVFNYRGCGKSKISTPRLFTVGHVADLTEVMEYIYSNNPSSTIIAAGVSMASLQLVRYVAECKHQSRPCRITAILVFSVIWNLIKTDQSLHDNFCNRNILSRFLASRYTNIMKENRCVFEDSQARGELNFDFEKAIKSRNLHELNDACIVPMFNYYDDRLQHTYDPSQNAHDLTVPVIAVNSFDDPFSPPDATPEYIAEENPNLILVTTRRGGHFGFLQGLFPIHKTYMNTVLTQFLVAVLEHDCFNPLTSTSDNTTHDNIIHTLL